MKKLSVIAFLERCIHVYVRLLVILVLLTSCELDAQVSEQKRSLSDEVKDYWYGGLAEISSYELSQSRYGAMHQGTAVLIFVTEDFSTQSNTKADNYSDKNVSVMKLNQTKKFNTGIYPYSLMNSTFYPITEGDHSLKITSSSQEWCGHTFMQLKNEPDQFKISIDSYFDGESAEDISMKKKLLEDDLWTLLRIAPDLLPMGEVQMIPSFFYLRLKHVPVKVYSCKLSKETTGSSIIYQIHYPELDRQLSIEYESQFPYHILSWKESYTSGWGASKQKLTTKAKLLESIRIDYWNKNSPADSVWRDKLKLVD